MEKYDLYWKKLKSVDKERGIICVVATTSYKDQ